MTFIGYKETDRQTKVIIDEVKGFAICKRRNFTSKEGSPERPKWYVYNDKMFSGMRFTVFVPLEVPTKMSSSTLRKSINFFINR